MQTKTCTKCGIAKEISQFPLKSTKVDGARRKSRCTDCRSQDNAEYHARTKDKNVVKNRLKTRVSKARWAATNRDFIYNHLLSHPCVKCGQTDPIKLEFDHLRNKSFNVSQVTRVSPHRLIEEVAKTQVLCANCHRVKTAYEQSWTILRWLSERAIRSEVSQQASHQSTSSSS